MPDVLTLKAAKFWVALVGVVVTAVIASTPDAPTWLKALAAVTAAVGVYLTPNASVPEAGPNHPEDPSA